jgi:hypothetical protein
LCPGLDVSTRNLGESPRSAIPLSIAALTPLLVAGATLLPLKEMLKAAKSLILL